MTTRLKHIFQSFLMAIVLLLVSPEKGLATDIRGQVAARYPATGQQVPFYGARVDLYAWNGSGWILLYTWITGGDGMYYMKNILPGNYYLQINNRWNYQIRVYPQQYQDIPQIIVTL